MIEREEQIFELWNKHPFAERALQTVCGKRLRILSPGILNRDSGPDFFDARLELDGQLWSGNIEIHVRASDWFKHGHTTDKAFGNVVLHVVCIHDCEIYDDHGNVIPVLVLTDDLLYSPPLGSARDDSFHQHNTGLDLGHESSRAEPRGDVRGESRKLESLGIERLNRRCRDLETELVNLKGDMEALFQRHLFRRFGMRTNSEPFQQLAHRVPGTIIRRQRNSVTDLEALLYGQSALLPEIPTDGYSADLLYRYVNFRYKYDLKPMYVQAWKFMRMRPSNFPTIRISQLAMLLHREEHIFTRCMDPTMTPIQLQDMFDVKATEYWDDHFRFGVYSGKHAKHIGEEAVNSILINAVGQLRYFLGHQRGDGTLKESALELLRILPAEDNAVIRKSGKRPENALESQGVLELLTPGRLSNDDNNIVSDCDFQYFSTTLPDAAMHEGRQAENYERDKINRPNRNLVREPGIRGLRLVG